LAVVVKMTAVSCEKELLWVVRCKKTESRLVENYCKIVWGYQMIEFWNDVFTT
jgi:hypothetical protein